MYGTAIVFGERVTLLGDAAAPIPGRVLLPGDADPRPPGAPPRLLLPGPGATVRGRADAADDPDRRQHAATAAEALGIRLTHQDGVDVATAERLCPPTSVEMRRAAAVLDLGVWRYLVEHCAPGGRLATLLEQRPEDLAPAAGKGGVVGAERGALDGAAPADQGWPDAVLSSIVARQKLISHLHAQQYADVAALSGCYPGIHQFLATELALALHTTDTDAVGLLDEAEQLRDRLPGTRRALTDGSIDVDKARAIIRATRTSSAEVAREVEQQVLPDATAVTATTLRRRAGRGVIAADPDGTAERHRRARSERHVWRAPDDDGMARLGIYAPAQDIAAMWEGITACADAIKRPGDGRDLGQRRADAMIMIFSDILAAGGWTGLKLPDTGRGRPRVTVTVPYTALLGHRAPCDLQGYGPVGTEQALPLVGGGDLYRMLCDPESGIVLDYGRTRYRPPPELAEFVRMRDGECPMPSCHHPAERGQVDHVVPARPDPLTGRPTLGPTAAHNLAPPCAHHHLAKDAGRGFSLHRARDGTYTWTTPLARAYTWRPEPRWDGSTDAVTGLDRGARSIRSDGIDATAGNGLIRGVGQEGSTASPDVPADPGMGAVCPCPDTCQCQQAPPSRWYDALRALTVDRDWADRFAREADEAPREAGEEPRDAGGPTGQTNRPPGESGGPSGQVDGPSGQVDEPSDPTHRPPGGAGRPHGATDGSSESTPDQARPSGNVEAPPF